MTTSSPSEPGRVQSEDEDGYCFACAHTDTDHQSADLGCHCPRHGETGRTPSPEHVEIARVLGTPSLRDLYSTEAHGTYDDEGNVQMTAPARTPSPEAPHAP